MVCVQCLIFSVFYLFIFFLLRSIFYFKYHLHASYGSFECSVVLQLTLLSLRGKMRRSSKVGRTWQVGQFIGRRCCPLLQTGSSPPRVPRQESGRVARPASAQGKSQRSWGGSTFPACGGCKLSTLPRTPPVQRRDYCSTQPHDPWNQRWMRQFKDFWTETG